MAQWRKFGATGEPGTCLWCGRKLRRKKMLDAALEAEGREQGLTGMELWKFSERPADRLGDYQDGVFCGLRCGYEFGLRFAELGRRLQPRGDTS